VRVAIFILSKTYGIASVVSRPRKDIATQSRMPGHAWGVVGFLNVSVGNGLKPFPTCLLLTASISSLI